MCAKTPILQKRPDERGAVLVTFAIMLFVIVAFAAVAVDLSHLFVVTNELQNAADAGALAGARVLYTDDGLAVNTGANQVARDAAIANNSENQAVEVQWAGGNSGDVQRGHWSFETRTFTPNDSLNTFDLWEKSTAELDADPNFINAVRVRSRRETLPAASYFARIFGHDGFVLDKEAVAYIGFAGTILPGEADQPIAICRQSIINGEGEYNCNVGRMINSGGNPASSNTGGWTNYSQPCETASTPTVKPLVCGEGNPAIMQMGQGIGTTGGEIATVHSDFLSCFQSRPDPLEPWKMTLPVVDCPGNNVSNCARLVGAVTLNVIWVTPSGVIKNEDVPTAMAGWTNTNPDLNVRWTSFVEHFNLKNVDGSPAPLQQKAIYFLPDCTPHIPSGRSGGENFGVLAKIPVLVR